MQKHFYTLVFVHDARGKLRKLRLPGYLVHAILLAAVVGAGALLAGIASYAHLLLTVTDYSQIRAEREELRQENRALRTRSAETHQQLTSLESLANEIAASYGLLRLRQTPFGRLETAAGFEAPAEDYPITLARYRFLQHHATAVTLYASGVRPLPGRDFADLSYTPSLWPVRGRLISGFGNRLDPFNGKGSFHSGVDISGPYGSEVRAAADGFVVAVAPRTGYGRVVVVDHSGGITTWYAHLSAYRAYPGQAITRGDVIGYVGNSGRSTSSHLHYEVRLRNAPLNPWRFLRAGRVLAARYRNPALRGGD